MVDPIRSVGDAEKVQLLLSPTNLQAVKELAPTWQVRRTVAAYNGRAVNLGECCRRPSSRKRVSVSTGGRALSPATATVAPASTVAPGLARCRAPKTSAAMAKAGRGPNARHRSRSAHPELLGDCGLQGQAQFCPGRCGAKQRDVVEVGGGHDAHQDRHHQQTQDGPDDEPGQRRPERELGCRASFAEPDGVRSSRGRPRRRRELR